MQDIPDVGNVEANPPQFTLTFIDTLQVLGLGCAIILVSILISTLPLIKAHPKSILTSID